MMLFEVNSAAKLLQSRSRLCPNSLLDDLHTHTHVCTHLYIPLDVIPSCVHVCNIYCTFSVSIVAQSVRHFTLAGGSSKTMLIVHICPNAANLPKTLSALNFAARARNAELSLGNRDTIKKWRDAVGPKI